MGYNTEYRLTWEKPECIRVSPDEEDTIRRWITNNEEASYVLTLDGTPRQDGKWYLWEQDLRELSSTLPGVKFVLEGFGEETGDLWRAYARNGKVEKVKAELKFKVPGFFKLKH